MVSDRVFRRNQWRGRSAALRQQDRVTTQGGSAGRSTSLLAARVGGIPKTKQFAWSRTISHRMGMDFCDFVRSGNQAVDPALYDIENAAIDRPGHVWDELSRLAPWEGRVLLDLGCGSGFWLPRYHDAADVIGVEPDASLLDLARARPGRARVLHGSAEHIPLPDESVDVVHARFAYFFPHAAFDPSPGLLEVSRVLRPGGRLAVIDNDTEEGEFADLLKVSPGAATQGQDTYARDWWRNKEAQTTPVLSSWQFDSWDDLAAVLRLEFPHDVANRWLRNHPGRRHLSYGYLIHTWDRRG